MEPKIFHFNQSRSFAIISQTNQPSQNMSSSVGFFITLAFIGCVLGCVFTLRKYQKKAQEFDAIIQKLEKLEKTQNQQLSPQTRKQVETLEKIWNQS